MREHSINSIKNFHWESSLVLLSFDAAILALLRTLFYEDAYLLPSVEGIILLSHLEQHLINFSGGIKKFARMSSMNSACVVTNLAYSDALLAFGL